MHQCICIFLQVKVYNLQNKVCIKPTKLQKEFKIIIKCNFFCFVFSLYICKMWFARCLSFQSTFSMYELYEPNFLFKVQPDVTKGVLWQNCLSGNVFFFGVFFFLSYFTCLCYEQSRETGFGLCLNCINAFCKI